MAGVCGALLLTYTGGALAHPYGLQLGLGALVGLFLGAGGLVELWSRRPEALPEPVAAAPPAIQAPEPVAAAAQQHQEDIQQAAIWEHLSKVLTDADRDAILLVDDTLQVLLSNKQFREHFWQGGGSAGQDVRELGQLNQSAQKLVKGLDIAMESGTASFRVDSRDVYVRQAQVDGRVFLHTVARSAPVESEELTRVRKELTQQINVAESVTEANTRLQEADRFRSETLANISHDLRTPLQSILGYVELMMTGNLGEVEARQLRGLETMHRNLNRLLEMIDNLLAVSQEEQRKLVLKSERLDLMQLGRDVVELFMPKASSAGIDLKARFGASADEQQDQSLAADADALKLHRIMSNLIGNAIKFTPKGGKVRVAVRRADAQERLQITERLETLKAKAMADTGQWPTSRLSGEWVLLRVLDTGQGIPKEQLERVFERWSTTGGHGLGLSITDSYVRLHGGFIEVNSEEGVGTAFSVWMPVAVEEEISRPSRSRPVAAKRQEPSSNTVLVVDDDQDIRELFSSILMGEGYKVVEAGTFKQMWTRLEGLDAPPAAVLLDYHVHRETSIETLKKLKASARWSQTPVAVVSGRSDDEVRQASLAAGAFALLRKPCSFEDLLDLVARMIHPPDEAEDTRRSQPVSRPLSQLHRQESS